MHSRSLQPGRLSKRTSQRISAAQLDFSPTYAKAITPMEAIISLWKPRNSFFKWFANQVIMFKLREEKNPTERIFMGKAFRLGFYLSSCAKLAGELYNYSTFTNKINVQQVCTWPPSHPWILWRTEQKDASFISQWNHSPKTGVFLSKIPVCCHRL